MTTPRVEVQGRKPGRKATPAPTARDPRLRILDGAIVLTFLGLTFLLGCFPLHDTDFWWHLRTGDLIRQSGAVPTFDPYLFGEGARPPWIDLHWGFEVLLSLGYGLGGVVLLNVAKCLVTTAALGLLLVAACKPGWPIWAMALAWLPALLLLGGRMYIRPETLTLLYLAADLTLLAHARERPRLVYFLPVIQVLWVNSQGLFVFGPILYGMAMASAALEPGAFDPAKRARWRTYLIAGALVGLACLANPYGLLGALFPITLLGTMNNDVFRTIGELQSIPDFIARAGFDNRPLQLHIATMALGALSFLIPLGWAVLVRLRGEPAVDTGPVQDRKKRGADRKPKAKPTPKPPRRRRAAEPVPAHALRGLLLAQLEGDPQ